MQSTWPALNAALVFGGLLRLYWIVAHDGSCCLLIVHKAMQPDIAILVWASPQSHVSTVAQHVSQLTRSIQVSEPALC